MKIYKINKKQLVPLTLESGWEFFSNPANLAKITPPELGFQVLTDPVEKIYPGLIVAYKIRPLLGIPVTWVTEITHVEEGVNFIDEQRFGPYKLWHHEHRFSRKADGLEIEDMVYYSLPLGSLGEIVHEVFVKYELEKIFKYRKDFMDNIGVQH